MTANHNFGIVDCYGRPHDQNGNTIFKPFLRPADEQIGSFDALSIAELDALYTPSNGESDVDQPDGQERPRRLIATSPNMPFVPNIQCGMQSARARKNGRYGYTDFTLWPQWFFPEHEHLVFVIRRPYRLEELQAHPLRMIWWDVKPCDFVEEQGSCYEGLGKLMTSRWAELKRFEVELANEVEAHQRASGRNAGWLLVCANALRDTITRLKYAPMTFRDLVYTVAAFQQQYLETRAYLDFTQKWFPRFAHPLDQPPAIADPRIMGCVTDNPEVVQKYHKVGVPVWYVRPPALIPQGINIVDHVLVEHPPRDYMVVDDWPDHPFPQVYDGFPCAELVRACLRYRPGGIDWKRIETPVDSSIGPVRNPSQLHRISPYPSSSMSPPSRSTMNSSCSTPCHVAPPTPHRNDKNAKVSTSALEKFKEPQSHLMPPGIPLWVDALNRVDTNPKRILKHVNLGLLVGYQFPDPHLFLNTSRHEQYISAWLSVRAAWIQSVINHSSQTAIPNTQQWRDFLFNKVRRRDAGNALSGPMMQTTRKRGAASAARRKEKHQQGAADIFGIRLPSRSFPTQVFWQEKAIQDGNVSNLTPTVTAQVLWELFELNFRLELLALERVIMAHLWEDPVTATTRDNLVRAVFPGDGGYLVGPLPAVNEGLAAESWEDRLKFVENFRVLLSGWDGEVPMKLQEMTVLSSASKGFKTFFDYFGRAAITPHRIPPPPPFVTLS